MTEIPQHPLRTAQIRVFREVVDEGRRGLPSYRAVIGQDGVYPIYFRGGSYEEAIEAAETWRQAELVKREPAWIEKQKRKLGLPTEARKV